MSRATALIDRVIGHADVLAVEGESNRLREAEKRAGKSVESAKRRLASIYEPPPCAARQRDGAPVRRVGRTSRS